MRFRKSVSITKGVKLNLSKSGASVTVGKGPVSFNLGSKGAFFNWSVPGTGVYDRVRIDTLIKDKLGLGKKAEAEKKAAAKSATKSATVRTQAGKSVRAPQRPSDEELAALEREQVFFTLHQYAPDVAPLAEFGEIDPFRAEDDVAAWLTDSEAPVPFTVQTMAVPEKRAVMIDLDLPEIEDMPTGKLVEMADGSLKIKDKTQKEQREDYRTCAFGLGEYVAANVLAIVPQAERVLVSAYTQRRDQNTGDVIDAFIYSVLFERSSFVNGYQRRDPYAFCSALKSRLILLSSGLMKEIKPYEAEDI